MKNTKKFLILFVFIIGIVILITYFTVHILNKNAANKETAKEREDFIEKNCRLIVNGVDITEGHYAAIDYSEKGIKEGNVRIPIVAVAEELGINVKWKSKTKAVFYLEEGKYFLDTKKHTFCLDNEGFNYLGILFGCTGGEEKYHELIDGEYIVGSYHMIGILYMMNASMNIDYETSTIFVDTKVEDSEMDCGVEGHERKSDFCDKLYQAAIMKDYFKGTSSEDHVHCEFCWKKIGNGGASNSGYCTLDKTSWICEQCFDTFKDKFEWEIHDKE